MSRLLGHDVLEAEFPLGVGSALGKNVLEPWLRQIGFHPERGGPLAEADLLRGRRVCPRHRVPCPLRTGVRAGAEEADFLSRHG